MAAGRIDLTGNSLFDATAPENCTASWRSAGHGSTGSVTVGATPSSGAATALTLWSAQGNGNWITVGEGGNGTLTITGSGLVTTDLFYLGSRENGGSSGGAGTLHLDGGTLGVNSIFHDQGTTATIYFNGGLLLNTYPASYGYVNNGTGGFSAYAQAGGAVINTNGDHLVFRNAAVARSGPRRHAGRRPDQARRRHAVAVPLQQHLHGPHDRQRRHASPRQSPRGNLRQRRRGGQLHRAAGRRTTGWSSAQIGSLVNSSSFTWGAGTTLGIDTGTNGDFSYGGNIAQPLGLTKLGANVLTLGGTNTYTGPTTVAPARFPSPPRRRCRVTTQAQSASPQAPASLCSRSMARAAGPPRRSAPC